MFKIPTSDEEERRKNMRNAPGPMLNPSYGVSSGSGQKSELSKADDIDRYLRTHHPNVHASRGIDPDRRGPLPKPVQLSKGDREDLKSFSDDTSAKREAAIEMNDKYRETLANRDRLTANGTVAAGTIVHPQTGELKTGLQARLVRLDLDNKVACAKADRDQCGRHFNNAVKREEAATARVTARAEAREKDREARASGQSPTPAQRTPTSASANPSDRLRGATEQSSQRSAEAQTRAVNAPARGQDDEHRRR